MASQFKHAFADAFSYLIGCVLFLLIIAAALGAGWRVFVWASGIEALR